MLYFVAKQRLLSIRRILIFLLLSILFSQLIIGSLFILDYKISNNNFLYYNLINQLPVFVIGISYYFFKTSHFKLWNWQWDLLGFGLFTVFSNLAWYSGISYLFSFTPILSGLSFIFLLELFQKFPALNGKLLMRIGQVSYSMYLLHFLFAHHLTAFLLTRWQLPSRTFYLLAFYVASIFLTFGLALLSERYIEKPGIQWGRSWIKKLNADAKVPKKD